MFYSKLLSRTISGELALVKAICMSEIIHITFQIEPNFKLSYHYESLSMHCADRGFVMVPPSFCMYLEHSEQFCVRFVTDLADCCTL